MKKIAVGALAAAFALFILAAAAQAVVTLKVSTCLAKTHDQVGNVLPGIPRQVQRGRQGRGQAALRGRAGSVAPAETGPGAQARSGGHDLLPHGLLRGNGGGSRAHLGDQPLHQGTPRQRRHRPTPARVGQEVQRQDTGLVLLRRRLPHLYDVQAQGEHQDRPRPVGAQDALHRHVPSVLQRHERDSSHHGSRGDVHRSAAGRGAGTRMARRSTGQVRRSGSSSSTAFTRASIAAAPWS